MRGRQDEPTRTSRRGRRGRIAQARQEDHGRSGSRRSRPSRFYLRVGLGRKATGSYYTPHSFVRFLVQETLGPQVAERSPHDDPQPGEILKLKVLDPAMGSGHFLVEACRFLGQHLYEAARLCDEKATAAERRRPRYGQAQGRPRGGPGRGPEVPAAGHRPARPGRRTAPLPAQPVGRGRAVGRVAAQGRGPLPPPGRRALPLRRRQEPAGRRAGQAGPLAGVARRGDAADVPRPPARRGRLAHRPVLGADALLAVEAQGEVEGRRLSQHLETHLRSALFDALRHVRHLEATVGVSLAEVERQEPRRRPSWTRPCCRSALRRRPGPAA